MIWKISVQWKSENAFLKRNSLFLNFKIIFKESEVPFNGNFKNQLLMLN